MGTRTHVNHVAQGQKIGPALTANTWNSFADAANAAANGPHQPSANPEQFKTSWVAPYVKAAEASDPNDVMPLDAFNAAFDETQDETAFRLAPILKHVTNGTTPGFFAIGRGAEGSGSATRGVMTGVVTAKVVIPPGGSWIQRAEIDEIDSSKLILHPGGSCQVLALGDPASNTECWAIIRLGNPQCVTYRGVTNVKIENGASGSVELYKGGETSGSGFSVSASLGWLNTSGDAVEAGTQVLVMYLPQDNEWLITGAGCPPEE